MLLFDHEGTHRRSPAPLDEHVDLADERGNAPGDERGALQRRPCATPRDRLPDHVRQQHANRATRPLEVSV